MLELKNEQRIELAKFGASQDGGSIIKVLRKAIDEVRDVTNITTADYGAQVEGRKIAVAYLEDILTALGKKIPVATPKEKEEVPADKVLPSPYE